MRNTQEIVLRVALCAAATSVSDAAAQTQIASDRPGIGSGSAVVSAGVVQLETGVSYSGGGNASAYNLGEALVRVGVSGVELELFGNSFVVLRSDTSPGLDDEGLQDAGLGVKLPLVRAVGGRADVSLQGTLTVPTGSEAFSGDEWVPAASLLTDVALSERAALSVNAGFQFGPGALDDVFSLVLTPGFSVEGGFGVYAGWAGAFSDSGDTSFAEAGVTYLATPNMQLDLNGGWSLDEDDWFFGAGLAVRRSPG